MTEEMTQAAARIQEVSDGKRCYDCGELFEVPFKDGEADVTKAEFDRRNPTHTDCFE